MLKVQQSEQIICYPAMGSDGAAICSPLNELLAACTKMLGCPSSAPGRFSPDIIAVKSQRSLVRPFRAASVYLVGGSRIIVALLLTLESLTVLAGASSEAAMARAFAALAMSSFLLLNALFAIMGGENRNVGSCTCNQSPGRSLHSLHDMPCASHTVPSHLVAAMRASDPFLTAMPRCRTSLLPMAPGHRWGLRNHARSQSCSFRAASGGASGAILSCRTVHRRGGESRALSPMLRPCSVMLP